MIDPDDKGTTVGAEGRTDAFVTRLLRTIWHTFLEGAAASGASLGYLHLDNPPMNASGQSTSKFRPGE
jgi:hypothetical protein